MVQLQQRVEPGDHYEKVLKMKLFLIIQFHHDS